MLSHTMDLNDTTHDVTKLYRNVMSHTMDINDMPHTMDLKGPATLITGVLQMRL